MKTNMKIWVLRACRDPKWDTFDGHVVAAMSESEARALAADYTGCGGGEWLDAGSSSCERIDGVERVGVILSSFNAA